MFSAGRCLLDALAPALLAAAIAGCSGPSAPGPAPSGPTEARRAPEFSLVTLDGDTYSLADLKGKPLVLNFWSSGCPHCATVAPYLQEFHAKHAGEGLVVLGVAGLDSESALREKASSLGVTYPVAISLDTGRAYGVRSVPATYFIDREGKIVAFVLGAQPRRQFEAALKEIL